MALAFVDNKAIVTSRDHSVSWMLVEDATIIDLKLTYREIEFLLIDSVTGEYYTLKLSNIPPSYTLLSKLLSTIDVSDLVTKGGRELTIESSHYMPIFKVAKTIAITQRNVHPGYDVDPSEADDIQLADFRVDPTRCLFTVDGFYTRPVIGKKNDVCLVGGAKLLFRGDTTGCGLELLPDAVECKPFENPEFNDAGNLCIKLVPGTTQGIVICGRLFIAGMDKEFKIRGDYAVFSFNAGFILSWGMTHAKSVFPELDATKFSMDYLTSKSLRERMLASEYSFLVTIKGTGYWKDTSSVTKFGIAEYFAADWTSNSFTGKLVKDDGRVIDYWGVYQSVGTVLYCDKEIVRDAPLRACTTDYMVDEVVSNRVDKTAEISIDSCNYVLLKKRVV